MEKNYTLVVTVRLELLTYPCHNAEIIASIELKVPSVSFLSFISKILHIIETVH